MDVLDLGDRAFVALQQGLDACLARVDVDEPGARVVVGVVPRSSGGLLLEVVAEVQHLLDPLALAHDLPLQRTELTEIGIRRATTSTVQDDDAVELVDVVCRVRVPVIESHASDVGVPRVLYMNVM